MFYFRVKADRLEQFYAADGWIHAPIRYVLNGFQNVQFKILFIFQEALWGLIMVLFMFRIIYHLFEENKMT